MGTPGTSQPKNGASGMDSTASQATTATPEEQRAAADARAATFGRLMALLMASPRHAAMTLADANAYVAPPVALGQFALVNAQQAENGPLAVVAAAWWAFVSPEVDQRLSESREAHFKLQPQDWRSGDQPWVIEALGEAKVVNDLVGKLAERYFKGKHAKIRAHLPDGRVAIGRLEPRPPGTEHTKA
jgi:cytolysin-activating lysine-acyltransferase